MKIYEKLYDMWWRNMGYVDGKYEEIRKKNRNENATADVCRQIARDSRMQTCEQIWQCITDVVRNSRLCWFGKVT